MTTSSIQKQSLTTRSSSGVFLSRDSSAKDESSFAQNRKPSTSKQQQEHMTLLDIEDDIDECILDNEIVSDPAKCCLSLNLKKIYSNAESRDPLLRLQSNYSVECPSSLPNVPEQLSYVKSCDPLADLQSVSSVECLASLSNVCEPGTYVEGRGSLANLQSGSSVECLASLQNVCEPGTYVEGHGSLANLQSVSSVECLASLPNVPESISSLNNDVPLSMDVESAPVAIYSQDRDFDFSSVASQVHRARLTESVLSGPSLDDASVSTAKSHYAIFNAEEPVPYSNTPDNDGDASHVDAENGGNISCHQFDPHEDNFYNSDRDIGISRVHNNGDVPYVEEDNSDNSYSTDSDFGRCFSSSSREDDLSSIAESSYSTDNDFNVSWHESIEDPSNVVERSTPCSESPSFFRGTHSYAVLSPIKTDNRIEQPEALTAAGRFSYVNENFILNCFIGTFLKNVTVLFTLMCTLCYTFYCVDISP